MTTASSSWRTANVLRQLKGGIGYRAGATALSFLVVPIMIGFLGPEKYGVWSTLLSILSWAVFFDLGVGNGLRNKVATALANDNRDEARLYIASGYTVVGLIVIVMWPVLAIAAYFIPWQTVFNSRLIDESELRQTFQVTAFFVLINFWIGLVAPLFGAVQKTSFVELGRLITNLLVFLFVIFLEKITTASIRDLALAYGIALVISNIILSLLFFRSRGDLCPTARLDKKYTEPLLTLGSRFFIIQIAALFIFSTDKIIIATLFGAENVTDYDVVFKVFSLIAISHGLIMAALWPAYTEAYERKDTEWIKNNLHQQIVVFIFIIIIIIIISLFMKTIIGIWIGPSVSISSTLTLFMAVLVSLMAWNNVFGTILSGIGMIRLGSLYTVFTGIANIPLSYYFAVILEFGVGGVVIGTIASISISAVLSPIQVYFFIYKKLSSGKLYTVLK